jgi:hypothetical protein
MMYKVYPFKGNTKSIISLNIKQGNIRTIPKEKQDRFSQKLKNIVLRLLSSVCYYCFYYLFFLFVFFIYFYYLFILFLLFLFLKILNFFFFFFLRL